MSVIVLTKDNFQEEVLNSDIAVVVDFYAPWCQPCRIMEGVVSKLEGKSGDRFRIGKVNVESEPELAKKYNILSIPTIKIIKNGKVVNSAVGLITADEILEMIV